MVCTGLGQNNFEREFVGEHFAEGEKFEKASLVTSSGNNSFCLYDCEPKLSSDKTTTQCKELLRNFYFIAST